MSAHIGTDLVADYTNIRLLFILFATICVILICLRGEKTTATTNRSIKSLSRKRRSQMVQFREVARL